MKKIEVGINTAHRLKNELEGLGISREFIESKDITNIYMAKKMVEGYDFGRELTQREKRALIYAILNNSSLNKDSYRYLSTLMNKFEQLGLEEQEIYGAIINLGVNGKILKQEGYGYDDLLHNSKNARETIGKYKDQIEKRVSSTTILVAIADTLTEQGQQELKAELEALGIDGKIIKQKDVQNLYMAKAVVEGYDFGRELTQREKYALIYAILDNAYLNKNTRKYLSLLMQKLEQIGLSEQEVYGTIINLGVNGIVLEESGYAYSDLLHDREKCNTIDKNKIETSVSSMTILTALSKNLNEQEEEELKRELEELGISKEFIETKRICNLYIAKVIVEGYDFRRQLSPEEKRAIMQAILNNAHLDKHNKRYLYKLMENLRKIGLTDQEIYGTVINLGVRGKVLHKITGFSYSNLLVNKDNACQEIAKYREIMQTTVAEGTIQKALKKAEKIMQGAVKGQKDKETIGEHTETRAELESLTKQEKSQQLEEGQVQT